MRYANDQSDQARFPRADKSRARVRRAPGAAGFTLVELLVVIGIIALLVSILFPALRRARDHAQRVQCMSNMRQVIMALTTYAGENKGYYLGPHTMSRPNGLSDHPFYVAGAVDFRELWKPFIVDVRIFYCPSNIDTFFPERQPDAINGGGWMEGWESTSQSAFSSYNYWPDWRYNGRPATETIWMDTRERPGPKIAPRRSVILTDLTMRSTVTPTWLGYNWFNHGTGGGYDYFGEPKKGNWAAVGWSDGSVIGAFSTEWKLRVITANGFEFYW